MDRSDIVGIVAFLKSAERLKSVLRSAHTTDGRQESTAEHSWRLALMAMLIAPAYPALDVSRLLRICLVHDLGEAIGGDIPAPQQQADQEKAMRERTDLARLTDPLPDRQRDEIMALWDEYEAAETPEARLAKALDKLETILQHIQGRNPPEFDYAFNLDYGRRYTDGDPFTLALRAILDRETAQRVTPGLPTSEALQDGTNKSSNNH